MAKTNKADMSCARVKQYTAFDVSKAERHNERKNETYENMNVIAERIPFNVHFKKPTAPTYMEQLKQMETDGQVSLRGLRKDATLFNEIVIDVNTMYFERNGGYEYAKQFYEEAYRFIVEKFGADNVISAVMHADEINVAASEELGKEVYHYHLHAMVLPVVEKEILWSKRCKDPELRGTVKEVVNQISHSKKWKSDIPLTDEKGNPLLRKNGKPMFRASYSILQDELFNYMTEQGFKGFQRGEYGSTAEHLTSLQYQIKQDKERLEKLQKRIQKEQVKYEPARHISKTLKQKKQGCFVGITLIRHSSFCHTKVRWKRKCPPCLKSARSFTPNPVPQRTRTQNHRSRRSYPIFPNALVFCERRLNFARVSPPVATPLKKNSQLYGQMNKNSKERS